VDFFLGYIIIIIILIHGRPTIVQGIIKYIVKKKTLEVQTHLHKIKGTIKYIVKKKTLEVQTHLHKIKGTIKYIVKKKTLEVQTHLHKIKYSMLGLSYTLLKRI
jgi:hypothetical protein